jgi:hypothetical protein
MHPTLSAFFKGRPNASPRLRFWNSARSMPRGLGSRPTIGLGGSTWREIGSEKRMKAGGQIIGDLTEADANRRHGTRSAVLPVKIRANAGSKSP